VAGYVAVLMICLLAIWAMAYWLWLLFARGIAMDGNRAAQTATPISRKTQPFKFWVTAIVYGLMPGFVVWITFEFVKLNF